MKTKVRDDLENLETSLDGLKGLLCLTTEDLGCEANRPTRVKQDVDCLYACVNLLGHLMDDLRGIIGRCEA